MEDRVERVARAIYDRMDTVMGKEAPSDWADVGPDHERARADWLEIARAAIEAMPGPDATDKDQRPWRYPDEWWWGDTSADIEDLITLQIEWGEHGTHHVTVSAPEDKLHTVLAAVSDSAVDYVLAHPELYGLKRVE